ncbi:MAG: response regulator transcription factor [Proteobacteria bacterium]|nr:response regulator transcription factor [Pseudomonadota bacterium]MBU4597080.1 response regulator transcription factor [Pseudomonadota bacterium]MBV1715322.1 response regulator transcription factor [Desulfarculus sp.]
MVQVKVLIASNNGILCKGMAKILSEDPCLQVIGELTSGQDVIKSIDDLLPDIVLMEFYLSELNGVDVALRIGKKYPNIKIIMFSTCDLNEDGIFHALEAGVSALLDKSSTEQELSLAINAAKDSNLYLSPSIASMALKNVHGVPIRLPEGKKDCRNFLTPREREIIQLVAEGLTGAQIADKLCISQKTVRNHRSSLMEKLNLRNSVEITRYAIKCNMVNIDS